MSDLEEALAYFDEMRGNGSIEVGFDCLDDDQQEAIIDAARKYAALTSPEAIEKAATAVDQFEVFTAGDGMPGVRPRDAREIAEAVLRSVAGVGIEVRRFSK